MARTVGIGIQGFAKIRENQYFYVDKTDFIREWWESGDDVTLITRPRRFGKTLNMSMLEQFFSLEYADRGDLFRDLSIWKEEKYRRLQGTYPVISLSFANVKEGCYQSVVLRICQLLTDLYHQNDFLLQGKLLSEREKEEYCRVSMDMPEVVATMALHKMSEYLFRYYGKKVIILLDEYDTPLQEAYAGGYWKELVGFTRSLFNTTFKTNIYLERAIMTGITSVSKESVFSDLNNLEVVTTTSEKYETAFGFTGQEVREALAEYGFSGQMAKVKSWYDGFTFGNRRDIYNPWSILNFLDKGRLSAYWANTSSNSLVGRLIREWFSDFTPAYNEFVKALLSGDVETMNEYMNYVALETFSSFDTGRKVSVNTEPERFYHSFVLGLLVELRGRYILTSNRESGYGRYDVLLEPVNDRDDAIIIEFKVFHPAKEKKLADTVKAAHMQIEEKQYAAVLEAKGIQKSRTRKYGIAFEGKRVLIG